MHIFEASTKTQFWLTKEIKMEKILQSIMLVCALALAAFVVHSVANKKLDILTEGRPVNKVRTVSELDRELKCLTRNVYYEASHEPAEGKIAVAQVTVNRVADGRFGRDICSVVNAKNVVMDKVVCQFSWLCDGSEKVRGVRKDLWDESERAAKKVMLEGFKLPSLEQALYFHAVYVNPQWPGKERVATIGNHIFYKQKGI